MITAYILIIWAHFIGDFLLQSDKIAINKSKDNLVLLSHVALYCVPLTLVGLIVPINLAWILFNTIAHFITDYITSRMASYFWRNEKRHWFFVTIGLDQAIHMTCLIGSYYFACSSLQ
jgi:membrane-bound metal-dependent hydrolase YbcI (DUF457 family)